jgi:hypothetical protein
MPSIGLQLSLRNPFARRDEAPREAKPQSPFAAVAIRPGANSCQAARAARGQRFLATEAPILPLESCNRCATCECTYAHFADRRRGPRRRTEGAPPKGAQISNREDRRSSRSRRAEDFTEEELIEHTQTMPSFDDTYFGFHRRFKIMS